jgi:sulfate adenylyltransferase
MLIPPHGGELIDRIVRPEKIDGLRAAAAQLPALALDGRELADLELIAGGGASPLTGFLSHADYESVLSRMRLADGTVWPLPFTLAVAPEVAARLAVGGQAALADATGRVWGTIHITDIFERDPLVESQAVYATQDPAHPGVAYLLARPRTIIGGPVHVLPLPDDLPFAAYRLTPRALRERIAALGWNRVAGFQTRNPIHRAHEHLTKLALEQTDGIVIHPLVGETKSDDVPASVRFKAYEALISKYYPKERTILAAFPAAMRYAGPREAIFHAITRKNYGITHFIVGRDHAGVGKYYAPLEAQQMFDRFKPDELGVTPLKFDPTFYCKACDNLASSRTCPHGPEDRLELSGTKVREMLRSGGTLPKEFSRPEIVDILRAHYASIEPMAPVVAKARGFILWFTGLSGAGKSTLANALHPHLSARQSCEILDGDEVRTYLSKGLGFSKEDRDTNIRRIGYVARLLARNGTAVITAAISPYTEIREEVRALAAQDGTAFVEVFANAAIDSLAARDVKGLYKKALAGELANFTGVSDPYEAPANPAITVQTDLESVAESLEKILAHLRAHGLVS